MLIWPLYAGLLSLIVVFLLTLNVLKKDPGNEKMREISRAIQEGAQTFLRREYQVVVWIVILVAIGLSLGSLSKNTANFGWKTGVAFVIGAFCSGLAGFISMRVGTRANSRTAQAARQGLKPALDVAFSGGSITGLSVVGIALLGLFLVYMIFEGKPVIINGYAMGASLMALFARVGGGIYTKGADMGADLVGKVEEGIPEDDPRNPAVIADNVGDNVGDTAGLGADLLESYVEAIIATIAIGYSLLLLSPQIGKSIVLLPLGLASWGILSSIIGVLWVRLSRAQEPQSALNRGVYVSAACMIAGSYFIIQKTGLSYGNYGVLGTFWSILAGLVSGLVIGAVSEFYTSDKFRPVRNLARSAQSGPAVVVINGLAVGMASTLIPVIIIAVATLVGYYFFGMYGVAIASLGMLSILGITLAVDSYGPVADNAGGIAEMSNLGEEVRKITDQLDAVGNTTAAIGKGFAIGSAAFAALGLFTAYVATLNRFSTREFTLTITDPHLVAGLLVGAMVPYLFCSLLAGGVGKVANKIIIEVRRQFKEIKGLMEGKARADSSRCVDIAARGALQNMMIPGILAILFPVALGFLMGPVTLGGFLIGALATGLPLGIQTANTGAALDNAKKYIEKGHFGGKGTEAHKASVVGDTVGDPLKDTLGPSINILIKLMTVISLVIVPLLARLP